MEKAYSPRFLSVITVTAVDWERGEKKRKKREKKKKEKESTRETQPKLFQSWLVQVLCGETVTNGCSSTADQDIDLIYSAGLYVKRFRLTIGRFQGRLVCINWTIRVEYFRVSVRISSSHARKKKASSQKLADFSFIPEEGGKIWCLTLIIFSFLNFPTFLLLFFFFFKVYHERFLHFISIFNEISLC